MSDLDARALKARLDAALARLDTVRDERDRFGAALQTIAAQAPKGEDPAKPTLLGAVCAYAAAALLGAALNDGDGDAD